MSILSLEQLKHKLRWADITLEQRTQRHLGKAYHSCIFQINPSDSSWPAIELWFDEDILFLDPLGFAQWHAHYDRWEDERRNLIEALRTVRKLMSGQLCLVEILDSNGKCWGGSLLGPEEIPYTLGKEAQSFRRIFFNQPPLDEAIDFGRYWEGKSRWVEWQTKQDTEKFLAENGMASTW